MRFSKPRRSKGKFQKDLQGLSNLVGLLRICLIKIKTCEVRKKNSQVFLSVILNLFQDPY